jgi:uncharacterized protein (TIGR02246 family)
MFYSYTLTITKLILLLTKQAVNRLPEGCNFVFGRDFYKDTTGGRLLMLGKLEDSHMSRYRLSRMFAALQMIGAFAAVLPLATLDSRAARAVNVQSDSAGRRDANDLAKISEQWAKEWGAKNLEALIGLYAEDAVFLPATGSRVTGRAAIRNLFEKALAVNTSELRVHSKAAEQSGNLAYDSGEYEEFMSSGGVTRSGRGNYLVVFRRNSKNQWHIVEHMWTDVPTTGQ